MDVDTTCVLQRTIQKLSNTPGLGATLLVRMLRYYSDRVDTKHHHLLFPSMVVDTESDTTTICLHSLVRWVDTDTAPVFAEVIIHPIAKAGGLQAIRPIEAGARSMLEYINCIGIELLSNPSLLAITLGLTYLSNTGFLPLSVVSPVGLGENLAPYVAQYVQGEQLVEIRVHGQVLWADYTVLQAACKGVSPWNLSTPA